ncbi:15-cis-phytoene synthase CrtB [Chitinasiproducens palmae]|uniref:Phytoene synthase n=1 Tax=Chitinasiproducens palmae TaxID=1770053 RepID=A0A1H2PNS6_9BURK|nr:15-cis-phytoene synthase CrtB [Chitinasiproducens palmae]SDV48316.1 phytoene synthase [Chitinasiproducens palmae]
MSEALLAHANETIAVGSKSFAAAARLFSPTTRRGALMLYAWCRHCDDVIDDQHHGFASQARAPDDDARASAAAVGAPDPEMRLAGLFDATRRAYRGEPMIEPAFAAFQDVALRHRIPQRFAFDHLEGFAMDVRGTRYETLDDTLRYCYHVAGVVGLMMAVVMGVEDEATLDRACDLGLAFQLTNIARDIVEDAAIGRCYLPAQWLREEGLPSDAPGALAAPVHRAALARLAARLIEHAEPYYESARAGIPALPLRSAWAIAAARAVYRQIGVKVRARGARAWDARAATSKPEKLRLLAGATAMALAGRVRRPGRAVRPRAATLWLRPAAARHADAEDGA